MSRFDNKRVGIELSWDPFNIKSLRNAARELRQKANELEHRLEKLQERNDKEQDDG